MTQEQQLRSKFIKDCSLPIPTISSPHFEYFLNLYEDEFGSKTKYDQIQNRSQQVLADANLLSKKMIHAISSTESYKRFSNDISNQNLLSYSFNANYSKQSIYTRNYADKYFISIDISSGNFTCLKYHDPNLVFNKEQFKQLVEHIAKMSIDDWRSDFSDQAIEYMYSNKLLRQVVFGYLNPRAQMTIQRYIIHKVIQTVVENVEGACVSDFLASTSDETILLVKDLNDLQQKYEATKSALKKHLPDLCENLKVEAFQLKTIENQTSVLGYVKEFMFDSHSKGAKYEIKGVPIYLFAQVYKHYRGMPIDKKHDLVFTYEGMTANFEKSIFE